MPVVNRRGRRRLAIMSDRPLNEIVGSEGLATTLASLASQVGSLEKSTNQQFASLAQAVEMQAEGIRRETASEAQRLNTLLEENAARSNMLVDALRREIGIELESNRRASEILISKYDGVIATVESSLRSEMNGIGEVAQERMARFMEVKELHWAEHRATHGQEAEAIRVAYSAMDKRLDGMNEFRAQISDMTAGFATKDAVDRAISNLEARVERNELDARRRDEQKEAKINELEKAMGREIRMESRPGQDLRSNWSAIVAAVLFLIAVVGIIVTLANFATAK